MTIRILEFPHSGSDYLRARMAEWFPGVEVVAHRDDDLLLPIDTTQKTIVLIDSVSQVAQAWWATVPNKRPRDSYQKFKTTVRKALDKWTDKWIYVVSTNPKTYIAVTITAVEYDPEIVRAKIAKLIAQP